MPAATSTACSTELRERIVRWFYNFNLSVDKIVLWSGRGQATVYQILHLYDTFGEVTNPHATELLLVANEFKLPKIFAVMTCTVLKLGSDWKAPLDQVSNKVKEYWSLRIAEIRHYEGDSESLDDNAEI